MAVAQAACGTHCPVVSTTLPIGRHEFTLTVEDNQGLDDTDVVVVSVADSTPPVVTAALMTLAVDEDEGIFRVEFSCDDVADPDPLVTEATLNGITVVNGQVVTLELEGDSEVDHDDGQLQVQSSAFRLSVECEDASGNIGSDFEHPSFVWAVAMAMIRMMMATRTTTATKMTRMTTAE